jgi:hypothetical protein
VSTSCDGVLWIRRSSSMAWGLFVRISRFAQCWVFEVGNRSKEQLLTHVSFNPVGSYTNPNHRLCEQDQCVSMVAGDACEKNVRVSFTEARNWQPPDLIMTSLRCRTIDRSAEEQGQATRTLR